MGAMQNDATQPDKLQPDQETPPKQADKQGVSINMGTLTGTPGPKEFFSMIQDKKLDAYHRLGGLTGIAKALGTDLENGISSSSIQERVQLYTENKLPEEDEITYCDFLKEALSDKMMLLLLFLGTVALIIGLTVPEAGEDDVHYDTAWIDGTFIIVAVSLVVAITTVNDYLKELKFQELDRLTKKVDYQVIRDGKSCTVDVTEIVVGDIVKFRGGTYIPADGIYISGDGVSIDESDCTGENDAKKKNHSHRPDDKMDPFIISGTNVLAANDGKFLVIGVGVHSFSGVMEMATRTEKSPTPLQEKLDALADFVGRLGIAVAVLLFIVLTIISAVKAKVDGEDYEFKLLLDFAIIGVSIVVVAVPEGLPLSVTIALAYSMSSMMKDNNMVRSLAACETMGAATNICSDKTGTLTTNEMTQVAGYIGQLKLNPYDHNDAELQLTLPDLHNDLSRRTLDAFVDSVAFNTTAVREKPDPGSKKADKAIDGLIWLGDKTEQAMLRWVNKVVPDGFTSIRNRTPPENRRVYPFQSAKKSMSTLVREDHPVHGRCTMQYSKGASEIILRHCNQFMDAKGEVFTMTDEAIEDFKEVIAEFASMSLRTIGVACVRYGDYDVEFPAEDPMEANMIFIGVVGIEDPVRTEVPDAVMKCQRAGVTVRMCTGDNLITAKAIGAKCGVYTDGLAMEGPAFRKLFCDNEDEFLKMLPKLQVLARCSPLDKQLLVANLMLLGEVVAVTGDGTNDAPALKLADVGFAMNDGTDVAKKASKIILLDNNFVSVVKACKWGRNVNDNIRKFLQFQFTVNVVLLIITFIGAVTDAIKDGEGKPPLAAVHLLWANLIMDTMAAMALSTEDPHDGLMDRMPTYRTAPLLTRRMWRFILGGATYQLTVVLVLIFAGASLLQTESDADRTGWSPEQKDEQDEDDAILLRTTIFNTFIYMQVFNWFHARKLYDEINFFEGFGRSKFFFPIVLFTAGLQAVMVELAQEFMKTTPPGGWRWLVSLVLAFLVWPIGAAIRLIPIKEPAHKTERLDKLAEHDKEEHEGEEVEGDYTASTKLRMVEKVREQQRALMVAEENEGQEVRDKFEPREMWQIALRKVKSQVVRTLRGKRGSTLGSRKKTSNLSSKNSSLGTLVKKGSSIGAPATSNEPFA